MIYFKKIGLTNMILLLCVLVVSVLAEPPVDNRYLPPQQGFSGGGSGPPAQTYRPPSQTYGPPGAADFGQQRQTDAIFRARPSTKYGAPPSGSSSYNPRSNSRLTSQPSSQYGTPQRSQFPSNQYGPPSFGNSQPSNQYGPPSSRNNQLSSQYNPPSFRNRQPSNQYGPPSFGNNQPSNQYSPPSSRNNQPSNQYIPPSTRNNRPSNQYGPPSFGPQMNRQSSRPGIQYEVPSQQYGPPEGSFGGNQQNGDFDVAQNRQYLPPGRGRGGYSDDEGNGEPANYSFEYMVKDEESGNDFGHRESRQGDRAEGLYYVLLPDGRKQTVEYEADQEGYKPRISYEDTGAGLGGYGRNSNALDGYQNGGGPY